MIESRKIISSLINEFRPIRLMYLPLHTGISLIYFNFIYF